MSSYERGTGPDDWEAEARVNSPRASGFYWVKATPNSRWEIAELIVKKWYVIGAGKSISESKFAEIGDRINAPDANEKAASHG